MDTDSASLDARIQAIDAATRAVAERLPFSAELTADMGETGALHLDLGSRGDDDDPRDTAGIDPDDAAALWYFDVAGGRETIASPYDITVDPAIVADWIARRARTAGSPAALPANTDAAALRPPMLSSLDSSPLSNITPRLS